MLLRLRRIVAIAVALLVTAFTLGRVRTSWTGRSAAAGGPEDPGRAAVSRVERLESAPGADPTIRARGR